MTNPREKIIEEEIYRLMDGFLVEGDKPRNIKRLNQDRHLFVENMLVVIKEAIKEAVENNKDEIKVKIARLDWIKILSEATKSRPTSWGKDVVREWRNASDEVWGALMRACYKAGIFKDWLSPKFHIKIEEVLK